MFKRCFSFVLVLSVASADESQSLDWPQWRGPNQDGVSTEQDWSHEWGADGPKRMWEFGVGTGHGAVAIVGKRLYTIGASGEAEETDTVYCLNTESGEVLWKYSYARPERLERTPTRRDKYNANNSQGQGVHVQWRRAAVLLRCEHR